MSAPEPKASTPNADSPVPESAASTFLKRIPTQKIASLIRFNTTRQEKRPEIVFPPPSWSLEEALVRGEFPVKSRASKQDRDDGQEDIPEPEEIAREIGSLIDALPPPRELPAESAPTQKPETQLDPNGPPLPPTLTSDSRLMRLLSSERVMNGSLSLGRQSVWSMLEQLKQRSSALYSSASLRGKGKAKEGPEAEEHVREDGGVMMYAPLEPTPESELELADSETVLEYLDYPAAHEPEQVAKVAGTPGEIKDTEQVPAEEPSKVEPSKSHRKRKTVEHVHWVPSTTKISVQAMWWGYRMYLPPPIMKKLDNKHLVATKRAAMITAALKWMLDKIPIAVVPPQIRPAALVLKRLAPYLGYVGVFIAWSWNSIQQSDKGDGIVLTATWLLPVALLPAPLNPQDFVRPNAKAAVPVDSSDGATQAESDVKV